MPYSDPEVSASVSYTLNVAGPGGSFFNCTVNVTTPYNELGQQDPVERDMRLQEYVNFLEASTDYAVSFCQKSADMTQLCTPDA